jgi:tetratricopeptide (TPR) repeat protein
MVQKTLICFLFVLLLAAGCGDPASDSNSVEKTDATPGPGPASYEESRRRHESGDLIGALAGYNNVLQFDSNHVGALGNRAILLEGRNEIPGALRDYDRLLRLEPDNVPGLAHRAALLSRSGNYTAALRDYDALVALRPNDPLVLNDRGFARYSLGDFSGSLTDFGLSLSFAPDFTPARFNRGNALYSLERYPEALADYQAVAGREPNHIGALVALGNYQLYQSNAPDSARHYFQAALDADPNPGNRAKADAWLGLGNLKFMAKDLPAAANDFDKGIQLDPNHLELRMNRGLTWYRLKQYDKAIEDYDQVLKNYPGYSAALAMRGYAKCELGAVSSGCLDLQAALRAGEKDVKSAIVRFCR